MKRIALITFFGILLISFNIQTVWAGKIDIVINKLVEKKILSESEAKEIINEIQKEADIEKAEIKKVAAKDTDINWYWKNGLNFETNDKAFKFKFGGRIMNDWAFMSEDDSVEALLGSLQNDTTEFRRARLYVSGTTYDRIIFKAQYDFAGGDADFKDVFIGLKKLPVVDWLKVGHFKEPFSLEELISCNYTTFMERSLPNAFAPGRNTGIGVHSATLNDRLTWAAGAFLDTNGYGDEGGTDHSYAVTARVTGLPWYGGKDKLLHLGLAYSYRDAVDDTVSFSERPEAHMAPRFVDTGNIAAGWENRLGLEAAYVHGPFCLQGEYIGTAVDATGEPDRGFSGYYAYASYFLTGEHRPYSQKNGIFCRVKPNVNFGKGGIGAWEMGVRFSHLDLDDGAITGGDLDDITLGLNWYLNPNVRTMLNYIRADLDTVGDADILEMRFQIDW
ncbi:MAG: porin [Deltaproteobacteria bacterium]|nr:porin [Deltaproteobacteria bacterium]